MLKNQPLSQNRLSRHQKIILVVMTMTANGTLPAEFFYASLFGVAFPQDRMFDCPSPLSRSYTASLYRSLARLADRGLIERSSTGLVVITAAGRAIAGTLTFSDSCLKSLSPGIRDHWFAPLMQHIVTVAALQR